MSESNEERQENELLAVESIYSSRQIVLAPEKDNGTFSAHVELPGNFKIAYPSVQDINERKQSIPSEEEPPYEDMTIQYLPPITLNFQLPASYPSDNPPSFTLSCKWLTVLQLSRLCKQLDNIWDEQGPGFEVLFEWMQFLDDDVLSFLHIKSPLLLNRVSKNYIRQESNEKGDQNDYDRRAIQDVASIDNLVNYLTVYDSKESIEQFNSSYYNCGVCFVEKLGLHCLKFQPCAHIYCSECVTGYFIVQIRDGSVRSLNCPEDKCETQADPSLVKKLVPVDVYEQYEKFLLQSTLDCMDDMTYCPRKTCQTGVLIEPDLRNMGRCPGCNFVFCVFCKRTYHGVQHCAVNNKELLALRDRYMNGTEEVRLALEKKYGKRRLQTAVEDFYTEAWIDKNSKNCPDCKTSIEKIDGCNKMACTKCKCYFCWICGNKLSHGDPYLHFSQQTSPCYNKLFLGETPDNDLFDDNDDWIQFVL